MDKHASAIAANEMPEGTQVIYAEYAENGSCTYIPNVLYATYEGLHRNMQLIVPHCSDRTFPLIIFIQGSAWRKQDVYAAIPNLCQLAAKGYVIASVEIRESDIAPFPAALEDVKCAIRFMRKHAQTYHVDPNRVAVWGDSSGGHLSLMTGLTIGEYNNGQYGDYTDEVNAVVDFYGVSDLLSLGKYNHILDHDAADSPEGLFIGGRKVQEYPELAKQASPYYQPLNKSLPPILIVHGDRDSIVHINQSIEMYKKLKEHGHQVLFYKVVGGEHGPGVWNPEVLQVTEKFLAAHLYRPILEKPPFQHDARQ
ncbi:alpha/beta hydrolase fold domain-containing protein [Paenibacillus septentrionalis]|uniref:Alpha/beta hydrolase fold domain-containing protein n=1 Tax=Paenibacillus septentrionalis TaxID=429342 RepID=A0ABW1V5R8_9BACL